MKLSPSTYFMRNEPMACSSTNTTSFDLEPLHANTTMQLLTFFAALALTAPALSAPAELATPVELDPRLSQVIYKLSCLSTHTQSYTCAGCNSVGHCSRSISPYAVSSVCGSLNNCVHCNLTCACVATRPGHVSFGHQWRELWSVE